MISSFPEFLILLFKPDSVLKILTTLQNASDNDFKADLNPYIVNKAVAYQVSWALVEWLEEIGWLIRVESFSFKYNYEFVAFYNNWKDNRR